MIVCCITLYGNIVNVFVQLGTGHRFLPFSFYRLLINCSAAPFKSFAPGPLGTTLAISVAVDVRRATEVRDAEFG